MTPNHETDFLELQPAMIQDV